MRLVHYSGSPIGNLRIVEAPKCRETHKPYGLWVSDDDCEMNWRYWCLGENFGLDRLTHVHDVELNPRANILFLRSASDIDAFTLEWKEDQNEWSIGMPWPRMRDAFDGLIITPYIWERRLDGCAHWYYGWDCASGCIWHPRAIASVALREIIEEPKRKEEQTSEGNVQ